MADTQIATSGPEGSLPPTMINPESTGGLLPQPQPTLVSGLAPPKPSLPQSAFDPVVANLGPKPAPTPAPTAQPTTAPAVTPTTTPQPAPTQQPAANQWRAVGDSIARGYQKFGGSSGTGVDMDANNRTVDAAGGRPPSVVLDYLKSLPDGAFSGQNIRFSTGVSNNPGEINLVPEQLAQLKRLGAANVQVVGVGDRAGDEGGHHYDLSSYNAQLEQDSKAAGMTFGGALPAVVHPAPVYYRHGGAQPPQPPTPGTGKTISDATAFIQQKEGGGPFVLYGHEGQSYDPNSMPTKPGYYGFPDWAGGYGPDGRQTHAAGGAQWEPDTWKTAVEGFTQSGLANQLGHTPDFRNPDDQKAVFNYWAARRYREQTGRDIVADLNAGHVDWGALGSEWSSLKNGGGGGVAGMTVSNLPGYQQWRQDNADAQQLGQQEIADMQKRMAGLEAGSPEQRALADQLLQKQIKLMDTYENMIAHPPTQKPHDMIGNFGSIATLIGIFAGRFAHRPMVASLNAAGAAMQAMNDNDYEAYKNAFTTWKTQADMTSTLLGMESSTYKGIMDDQHKTMEEKLQMMETSAKIYQNQILLKQADAGNYEKMWEYAQKLEKASDDHKLAVAQITEAQQKTEAGNALTAAVQADDQKWITDNPDAYQAWIKDHPERAGSVPPEVHFDNQTKREAQEKTAARAGTEEAVQVTWQNGQSEILYGQRGAPGHFVTSGGRDVDISAAKSVLPMTKSQAGTSAMALPDYQGPAQWEGMPSKPPPGIRRDVWSMALDWVQTGKQPTGWGRMDQATREQLQQAYPVAQQALGIKPEEEYERSIKFAAAKAREESIERGFGSGVMGRNLIALNTVADHIALFRQYADALRNGDVQRINQLQNRLATEAGSPEIINFALAGRITGDEVVRLLTTTGGTVTDREDIATRLASYDSPEQLQGAADTLTNYVRGRYAPLRQQYARGDAEKEKYFDQNMVTPEAHQLFTGPQRPIGGETPPPPATAAPGATTAPAPGTAPPRPSNIPAGSQYSPSRNQWRDSTGKLYDVQGNPL